MKNNNTIRSFYFTGTNDTVDEDILKKHPELWEDIQGKLGMNGLFLKYELSFIAILSVRLDLNICKRTYVSERF